MGDKPVILVTGGRRVRRNGSQPPALWRDLVAMLEKHGPCTIRHGDCPHPRRDPTRASIDQLAAEFALQLGHVPQPFQADWSRPSRLYPAVIFWSDLEVPSGLAVADPS